MPPDPKPAGPAQATRKRAFFGSAWVIGEFAADQAIRLVRSVLLTRLISQDMFGLLGLTGIVVALVAAFSDFGGNIAIIRKKRENEQPFLDTAWTLSLFRGIAVWLVVTALAYPASLFYDEPLLLYTVPIIGFGSVLNSAYSTKISTTNRDLRVASVTAMKVGSRAIGLAATIAWALAAPESLGVIVVGPLLSASLVLVGSFLLLPGPNNRPAWNPQAAGELIRFGRWIFLSTLLTFFIQKGDMLVVGKLEDTAGFAVYSIAFTMANVVPQMFLALGGRIIFPVYSAIQTQPIARLRRNVLRMRGLLLAVFLPMTWVLILFGEQIVAFVYPASYAEAGWMLELLAAGGVARIIAASAGGILLAKGDSFAFMLTQVGRGLMMLAGMWIGYLVGDRSGRPDGALEGLIIGMGVAFWLNYLQLAWFIRRHGVWLPGLDFLAFGATLGVILIRYILL